MGTVLRRIRTFGELVKFEQTALNLPFAYLGAFLAARGWPTWHQLLWITVAMAGTHTAAMAFNRLFDAGIDAGIDARTPRTRNRHFPAGLISRGEVWLYALVATGALLLAALNLHPLAAKLFPLAVLTFTIYPFTKRFTWLCHVWLGLSVAWAPLGAYVAVAGRVTGEILLLAAIITLWNAGFDTICGTQDMEVDRENGIHSIPARFGLARALQIARWFHLGVVGLTLLFGLVAGLLPGLSPLKWGAPAWIYLAGWLVVAALLHYEHHIISPQNLSRLGVAFFNVNGYLSAAYFLFTAVAVSIA